MGCRSTKLILYRRRQHFFNLLSTGTRRVVCNGIAISRVPFRPDLETRLRIRPSERLRHAKLSRHVENRRSCRRSAPPPGFYRSRTPDSVRMGDDVWPSQVTPLCVSSGILQAALKIWVNLHGVINPAGAHPAVRSRHTHRDEVAT